MVVTTPLTVDACVMRLNAVTSGGLKGLISNSPIIGKVDGNGFTWRKRLSRKGMRTPLYGTFQDAGDHTRIVCRSGISLWSIAMIAFCILMLAKLSATIAFGPEVGAAFPGEIEGTGGPVEAIVAFTVAILFGSCLLRFMAHHEKQFMLKILLEKVAGNLEPPSGSISKPINKHSKTVQR